MGTPHVAATRTQPYVRAAERGSGRLVSAKHSNSASFGQSHDGIDEVARTHKDRRRRTALTCDGDEREKGFSLISEFQVWVQITNAHTVEKVLFACNYHEVLSLCLARGKLELGLARLGVTARSALARLLVRGCERDEPSGTTTPFTARLSSSAPLAPSSGEMRHAYVPLRWSVSLSATATRLDGRRIPSLDAIQRSKFGVARGRRPCVAGCRSDR